MTAYEELLEYAVNEGITVIDFELGDKTKGLYCDGIAFINKNCCTAEKFCTLAEELGHHYTATSNIICLDTLEKRKQEQLGRRRGYETILSLERILDAIIEGYDNLADLAEQLEVTPEYLQEALVYYGQKHGTSIDYHEHRVIFSDASVIVHPLLDEAL